MGPDRLVKNISHDRRRDHQLHPRHELNQSTFPAGSDGRPTLAKRMATRAHEVDSLRAWSAWRLAFLAITIAQAVLALGLELYVFGIYQTSLRDEAKGYPQARTIPTYLSLFIFGFLYQIALAIDALVFKNTIQLIGLVLYNLGLTIYAAVQVEQIHDAVNALSSVDATRSPIDIRVAPELITLPCIIALGTILLAAVAWKLYVEFQWSIYKHISADLRMRRCYMAYQIYIAMLKFDFFFFLSFSVQFLVVVANTSDAEFALTIAALPITLLVLFLAAYWTRRESYTGMFCTIVLYFAALAYFLFKLVRMYDMQDPQRVSDYLTARKGLTLFAVITVLMLIVTIINAVWCTCNFNLGLKPHIQKRRTKAHGPDKLSDSPMTDDWSSLHAAAGYDDKRMIID